MRRVIIMNNKVIIALASIVVLSAGGFALFRTTPGQRALRIIQPEITATPAQEAEDFIVLTSAQLTGMLEKKDFFFVNVHIPYEGEIISTDAFIPYDTIGDELEKLPSDKNAKIVLYCKSGRMSEIAARELTRLGYTQVSHLAGGMNDWGKAIY